MPEAGTEARPVPSQPSGSPFIGAGFDTWAGSPFVQARLGLLGKTVFLLSFGFFLVINGLLVLGGGFRVLPMLVNQANIWHALASSVMALLWVVTRLRPWSLRVLGALDAGSLLWAGIALAMMAAQPDPAQLMAGLFALSVTMMARAVLIPSTAKRTFVLSWISAAPLLLVSAVFHEPMQLPGFSAGLSKLLVSVNALLWTVISVTLSTVTSATIYGLRQQVKQATEIGHYTLEERIGTGGMGEVWKAHHRMLIRPAAVKLVKFSAVGSGPGRDPELRLRRFEREARATAGLKSPHTVQLYDFGMTDDGTLYYVMELLDGMDLDTLVERFGPIPPERAVHFLLQACASLDDAHQNGLVHRDVKPANLIVSRVGADWDFVKVLDFGLVKLDGARQSPESVKLTGESSVSGTPGYMAPEVVLGTETDHRIDVYSLGCVAYWLLTGKLLFEGPGAVKVMYDHVHTPPTPPSLRAEQPIPQELEALILECLSKDREQRPASAAALQERLGALAFRAPWTRERAQGWWREHAPALSSRRPLADVVLSQEARPVRVIGRRRA